MMRKDEMNEILSISPSNDACGQGLLLPQALLGYQPEVIIVARGDSMIGAGFADGDLLRVRLTAAAHDGDIVVALVDGSATVKVLFSDDEGRRWLVPCNERYDATLLTDGSDVRIVGTVVGVEKRVVRASSADCMRAVRRTLAHRQEPPRPTAEQADGAIAAVAPQVRNGRQWYAVYRALADQGCVAEGCFREFAERVARVVPAHAHPPVAKELGRLAVQSFRKRVALWDASDAPVSGQRFAEYRHLAHLTAALLSRRG